MKAHKITKGEQIDLKKDYFVIQQDYESYGSSPFYTYVNTGEELLRHFGWPEEEFEGIDYMLNDDNGEDVLEIHEITL